MSNKTLNRLGNASAGNKEENIFKVFAYLNTRQEYSPMMLPTKVSVKPSTILSYLKQIQKAQFFNADYQHRVARPFEQQIFAQAQGEQKAIAEKYLASWQKEAKAVGEQWKTKNSQLLQYVYQPNAYTPAETFYERLEQSILIYELLKKQK